MDVLAIFPVSAWLFTMVPAVSASHQHPTTFSLPPHTAMESIGDSSLKGCAPRQVERTHGISGGDTATVAAEGDWWTRVRQQIEGDEYMPCLTEDGLQAPNRAQGLRTW